MSATDPNVLPHTAFSAWCSGFFARMTGAISWLWFALMIVIVGNVIARYVFGEGRVEFEEIQWHLYACGFLFGIAACMESDRHVRVDVLRASMNPRLRSWIELYGLLLLFFPFVALLVVFGVPFVAESFFVNETSSAPGGLPLRWLIKLTLPLAMILAAVAGLSRLSRVWVHLFGDSRS